MTHYSDLTQYTYIAEASEDGLLNVGWLDASEPYPQGAVTPGFTKALARLCREGVFRTRGLHRCNLCPRSEGPGLPPPTKYQVSGEEFTVGGAEIRVRGSEKMSYAAPDMIIHYVVDHKYLPPTEFVNAVISSDLLDEQ